MRLLERAAELAEEAGAPARAARPRRRREARGGERRACRRTTRSDLLAPGRGVPRGPRLRRRPARRPARRGDALLAARRRQAHPSGAHPGGRREPRAAPGDGAADRGRASSSSTPTRSSTTTCRPSTTTRCAAGGPPATSSSARTSPSWPATGCSPRPSAWCSSARRARPTRCSPPLAEIAAATGVQGMVGGQYMDVAGGGRRRRRPAHAARAQDRPADRGRGGLRRAARRRGATLAPYRAFAAELGLLFQIVDDILDVVGGEDELGKSVRQGHARSTRSPTSRASAWSAPSSWPTSRSSGALRAARRAARRHGRPRRRRRASSTSRRALTRARRRRRPQSPVLYSVDDAVSGQDLRPRRPPTILRARADAARRRDPRDHPVVRQRDRRSPGRQPRRRRAHGRAAQRPRQPARQDRLGRGPPVLRAQDAHRPPRAVRHHPPVRRPLRVPVPCRVGARRRRHRPRLDLDQLRAGPGRGRSASPARTAATWSACSATARSRAASPSRR